MVKVAVDKLSRNPAGFYLFVEGGQIDFAHHGNEPIAAIYEFIAFDRAIGAAMKKINTDETLVMVSADHGHVFSIGTYGKRGADLFGVGSVSATRNRWSRNGTDDENTFIVGYANGPGWKHMVHTNPDNITEERCGREVPSKTESERADPTKHPELMY